MLAMTTKLESEPGMQALASADQVEKTDIDLRWHVLLTEPKRERVARDRLKSIGFKPYLPLIQKRTFYQVRSAYQRVTKERMVERAMFPGYLFLPLNLSWSFGSIYTCAGLRTGERQNVSPFLKINGRFVTIAEDIMAIIKSVEGDLANPKVVRLPYKIGDTVRVLDGPLSDKLLKIEKLDDEDRIGLLMDLLGAPRLVWVTASQIAAV